MEATMDARDADLPRQIAAPVHDRHCPFVMTADGEERAKRSEKRGERDARSPRSLLTPLHSLLVCGNDRSGEERAKRSEKRGRETLDLHAHSSLLFTHCSSAATTAMVRISESGTCAPPNSLARGRVGGGRCPKGVSSARQSR